MTTHFPSPGQSTWTANTNRSSWPSDTAGMQTVRVSVHLDTTAELLIQPGRTVPPHVTVGESTVFSGGAAPTRAAAGGWR